MATTWNPSDKGSGLTLSAGDLHAANSADFEDWCVRSVHSEASGKRYFEQIIGAGSTQSSDNDIRPGITNAAETRGFTSAAQPDSLNSCYVNAFGQIYIDSSQVGSIGGLGSAGDRVCVAVDIDAELIWFRANNGNWNGSGAADPGAGTGGIDFSGMNAGPWFILGECWGRDTNFTLAAAAADWGYSAPGGFTEWNGGGSAYTLSAAAGAPVVAGVAASVLAARVIAGDPGDFVAAGQAAGLLQLGSGAYQLAAETAVFAEFGQVSGLSAARLLSAVAGAYVLAAPDATPKVARKFAADGGGLSLADQAGGLILGRLLAVGAASHVAGGQAAQFGRTRSIAVETGVFASTAAQPALHYSGWQIWTPLPTAPATWAIEQAMSGVWTPEVTQVGAWT